MNFVGLLFRSSIGRKILMAATGVILIGFVVGHLVGNLQVFQNPDHINGYAQFLHELGPLLWIVRIGLLGAVIIHVWAATVLTLENNAARGQEGYAIKHTIQATLSSRTMRLTGYVVLAFLIYHIAHFTLGAAQAGTFKDNLPAYTMQHDYRVAGFPVIDAGASVADVHSMGSRDFKTRLSPVFTSWRWACSVSTSCTVSKACSKHWDCSPTNGPADCASVHWSSAQCTSWAIWQFPAPFSSASFSRMRQWRCRRPNDGKAGGLNSCLCPCTALFCP